MKEKSILYLLRVSHGKTVQTVAEALGITLRHYQRLETGKIPVSIKESLRLEALYQLQGTHLHLTLLTWETGRVKKELLHSYGRELVRLRWLLEKAGK